MQDDGFVNPQELVARIGVRAGMRVADFGSGSGEIAVIIAKIIGKDGVVTAIDVLQSAIESVQARAKSAALENIVPVRANLEISGNSKLDDNSQDAVFMANILWQSGKKLEILQEAARVLKSGGIAAMVEWEREGTAGPPPEMRIGKEELKTLLNSAGLSFTEVFPAGGFHYALIAKKS